MKLQSTIFVLFLFAFSFLSTRSWAQTYSIQPKNELEASQDARWLSEETQRTQPVISEARKGEIRSADAMHWTAVNAMHWTVVGANPQSQILRSVSKQPINTQKVAPSERSSYRPVGKPVKTMEKPATYSL